MGKSEKLFDSDQGKKIRILAIESSCDETSASVVEVTLTAKSYKLKAINILSNIVSSQIKLHAKYGGVYPELASREHVKNIIPVIEQALDSCKVYRGKGVESVNQILDFTPLHLKPLHLESIDYIAVTTGPGLIGSLLVGVETAKTLAYVLGKPIVPVNHLEGHIYANFIGVNSKFQETNSKQISNSNFQNSKQIYNSSFIIHNSPKFPILALIVSGGHTSLVYMKNHLDYEIIGETLDDAAGEAFDKVAAMLGLEYPGGPEIEAQAAKFPISNPLTSSGQVFQFPNKSQMTKNCHFDSNVIRWRNPSVNLRDSSTALRFAQNDKSKKLTKLNFPRPMINSKDFDFSFSGLKTAVLYTIKRLPKPLSSKIKALICQEFQDAVAETLVTKTLRAAEKYQVKSILLGGGVASNSRLREEFILKSEILNLKSNFFVPVKKLCTDNAAVIGVAAAYKILAGKISSWDKVKADANLRL